MLDDPVPWFLLASVSFQSPVGRSESSSFSSDNLNIVFSFSRVIQPNRRSSRYGPGSPSLGSCLFWNVHAGSTNTELQLLSVCLSLLPSRPSRVVPRL